MSGFAYLASPYTHDDPLIREERYLRVMEVVRDRLVRHQWTYSPIVHCHDMAKIFGMPVDYKFWHGFNNVMILAADEFIVLRLKGWNESLGVKLETQYAGSVGKPITYL